MEPNQLETLTASELIFLQKHLKLGREHLKEHLADQEIEEILKIGRIAQETKEDLQSDKAEMSGRIVTAVNSALTAILGGWMGFTGFIGMKFDSAILCASVVAFAGAVGAWAGYQTVRYTKKSAQKALEKRRLQKIELLILKRLKKKRNEEISATKAELDFVLQELGVNTTDQLNQTFHYPENGISWLDQILSKVNKSAQFQDKRAHQKLLGEIIAARASLFKSLDHAELKQKMAFTEIFNKLSRGSPHPASLTFWVKKNLRSVLLSSVPAILGGLSSLFVYINGIPKVAKDLGQEAIWILHQQPQTRMVEMAIALAITAFFAYSFFHINYKNFRRDAEISNTRMEIVQEENIVSVLDDELLKLKTLYESMAQIALALRQAS